MEVSARRAALGHGWSRRKKRSTASPLEPEVIIQQQAERIDELEGVLEVLFAPLVIDCPGVYNMDKEEDKLLLADAMWAGNFMGCMQGLRDANPELVELLAAQLKNNYHPAQHLLIQAGWNKARQLDGILANTTSLVTP